jgi:hypothetical protein
MREARVEDVYINVRIGKVEFYGTPTQVAGLLYAQMRQHQELYAILMAAVNLAQKMKMKDAMYKASVAKCVQTAPHSYTMPIVDAEGKQVSASTLDFCSENTFGVGIDSVLMAVLLELTTVGGNEKAIYYLKEALVSIE